MEKVAVVLLDDALQRTLDYAIPEELRAKLKRGMRVRVGVKNTLREGTLIDLKESSPYPNLQPLKELLLEEKAIPEDLFKLATWLSHYYCTSLQHALRAILPPSVKGDAGPKMGRWIQSNHSQAETAAICSRIRDKSPKQAAILDLLLQAPKGMFLSEMVEKGAISKSSLATLISNKTILSTPIPIDRALALEADYLPTFAKTLSKEQQSALESIKQTLNAGTFHVRLIHGITGSGKTEVYLQAISHALSLNRGVIFLVPEIALTSQMVEKFKSRFQERIAILHSKLSSGERFDAWHAMQAGKIRIAIGARSAIFSPIQNLGLIVVDEEHEASYKSDDTPHYHARDVAIVRGQLTNATVVLGSATPSLESFYNTKTGKYTISRLTTRADSAKLPRVTIVDMKEDLAKQKRFSLFSQALIDGIERRIRSGEQIILFLNRRGYHSSQLCKSCGAMTKCPHCDINLTFHLSDNRLVCHCCGFQLCPPPKVCPECKQEDTLKFKGAGTQLVERSLHALFPSIRTLRLDADTTRHKGSHDLLFKQFRSGKADVLIGTQMIAKGLHFPQVTLVAVLNADSGLQIPDFRAGETTFQLLTQVAGRSGRGMLEGEVIVQTYLPHHPIIQLTPSQDYEQFFEQEIPSRELFHYPPFSHLIKLLFKGQTAEQTAKIAEQVRAELLQKLPSEVELLPVVPCGVTKIKDQFRFQFLIKTPKVTPLLPLLKQIQQVKRNVQLFVDVDPLSTF